MQLLNFAPDCLRFCFHFDGVSAIFLNRLAAKFTAYDNYWWKPMPQMTDRRQVTLTFT